MWLAAFSSNSVFWNSRPLGEIGEECGTSATSPSRRAALWALTGAATGVLIALWLDEPASALLGLHSYNPALAALALSQACRRPWQPLLGILLAVILTPGFTALHLPALTAPFVLACWLVHASQRMFKARVDSPFESP